MNNDVNKKLSEILSGLDKGKISNSTQTIEQLLNTPDGKRLMQSISSIDKAKLAKIFMNMDSNELKSKLQNIDLSKLSKITADDINRLK